ncbi:MAG: hypothetical protein U5K28_00625 [Halobacteriales archaeon]|nr:hypothetical protein [Halobacteriales archaeon]
MAEPVRARERIADIQTRLEDVETTEITASTPPAVLDSDEMLFVDVERDGFVEAIRTATDA